MEGLAELAEADVRRAGLGGLGGLAASWPAALAGDLPTAAKAAARWERAHASVPARTVLTRDSRSTTAQLRNVVGVASHLVTSLMSVPHARLEVGQRHDLLMIRRELHGFGASAIGVQQAWRRRLSDLNGRSDSPGEVAYVEPKAAVDRFLRDGGGIRRCQQNVVDWLIGAGRIFVPRKEAVHADIYYLRRPTGGSRPLQAIWVRTGLERCLDELASDKVPAGLHQRRIPDG